MMLRCVDRATSSDECWGGVCAGVECAASDAAELCRRWGFHWDDNRKTCVAGGH